ncbi:MAG: cytochrome o ubiquinol oxidase subunit III [Pseudomonadota bacterium]
MNTTLPPPPADFSGFVEDEHEHDYGGDTVFGFWVYILSDCILFATLFAVFAVIGHNFAGTPEAKDLFNLNFILVATVLLLVSSSTFGMAMLSAQADDITGVLKWLAATFALGFGFLAMEIYEFWHFANEGATLGSSAAWSAFYALIGTHGLHVLFGLIWMVVLVVMILKEGLSTDNRVRMSCLSLFWHFLDIIWICVFSVVYLMGVM